MNFTLSRETCSFFFVFLLLHSCSIEVPAIGRVPRSAVLSRNVETRVKKRRAQLSNHCEGTRRRAEASVETARSCRVIATVIRRSRVAFRSRRDCTKTHTKTKKEEEQEEEEEEGEEKEEEKKRDDS